MGRRLIGLAADFCKGMAPRAALLMVGLGLAPLGCRNSSDAKKTRKGTEEVARLSALSLVVDGAKGQTVVVTGSAPAPLIPGLLARFPKLESVTLQKGPRRLLVADVKWTSDVRVHRNPEGKIEVAVFAADSPGKANSIFVEPTLVVALKKPVVLRLYSDGNEHLVLAASLQSLPTQAWNRNKANQSPAWLLRDVLALAGVEPGREIVVHGRDSTKVLSEEELRAGKALLKFSGPVAKVKLFAEDGSVAWRIRNVQRISISKSR